MSTVSTPIGRRSRHDSFPLRLHRQLALCRFDPRQPAILFLLVPPRIVAVPARFGRHSLLRSHDPRPVVALFGEATRSTGSRAAEARLSRYRRRGRGGAPPCRRERGGRWSDVSCHQSRWTILARRPPHQKDQHGLVISECAAQSEYEHARVREVSERRRWRFFPPRLDYGSFQLDRDGRYAPDSFRLARRTSSLVARRARHPER